MIAVMWIGQVMDLVEIAPHHLPHQYETEKKKVQAALPVAREYWERIFTPHATKDERRHFRTIADFVRRDVMRASDRLPAPTPGREGLKDLTERDAKYAAAKHALGALYTMLAIIDASLEKSPWKFDAWSEFADIAFFARSARCARERRLDQELIDELRREQVASAVKLWQELKREGW